MVADEKKGKELKSDQLQDNDYVSQFTYAISRVKKHKSESFDLMAEKAIQFFLSNQSNDLAGKITNAIAALFYFLAFAINHPVLTHKLHVSLAALGDPELDYDVKRFAIEVMKDPNVWDKIVNNPNLRPQILKLTKTMILGAGLPFPSYKAMEAEYIQSKKSEGHSSPSYHPNLYIKDLMKLEIEGFADAPKRGTQEYKEKRAYINDVLKERSAYAKIVDDEKTLDAALTSLQALMANENINQAIVDYVGAIGNIEEVGPIPSALLPVIEAVLSEDVGFKMLAPVLDRLPKIVDKIPSIKGALPDFINFEEMHKTLLKGKNREETYDLFSRLFAKYGHMEAVYAGYQVGTKEGNAAVVELFRSQSVDEIWIALTAHPTLIPYAAKVVEAYFDKNANLTFNERKELHDAKYKVPPYTKQLFDKENAKIARTLKATPKEYVEQIAHSQELLDMSFKARKALYDGFNKKKAAKPVPVYTQDMYLKEQADAQSLALSMKEYLPVLKDFSQTPEVIEQALQAIQSVMSDKVVSQAVIEGLNYEPVIPPSEKELLPPLVLSLIRTMLDKGIDALDPLLAQLPAIASKMPAIQRSLPSFIKLDELTEALLGDDVREYTFDLVSIIFSNYSSLEEIYAAEDKAEAMLGFVKSGRLDRLLVSLTTHPTLMPYVVKLLNGYINAMDMSAPASNNYTEVIIKLLQYPTLWEQIITSSDLQPYMASIVETYLSKVAGMTFDERKTVYDRTHKESYTQEMYEQEKAAAVNSATVYPALLRDKAIMSAIAGVGKFTLMEHNQDILNYLSAPKTTELLPSTLIPIITALIDGDKIQPLIGRVEAIFRILTPNNFTPDAPEFGKGIMDKSLLDVVFNIFDPSRKEETYNFLKAALGEVNNILAEFSVKPLFVAAGAVIDIMSNNPVLKGFIEANSNLIAKVIRYVSLKNFGNACARYGVKDEFWGVLGIVFKDLGALSDLLVGLQEITNAENYTTHIGIEKAIDTVVRELVKLLNHPVVGAELKQFIKDHKDVFISLINGVMDNIPTAKPYITQYVMGLGLTFSDVLDQLVHNPNDLIKLLDAAKDIGALRGEISKGKVATVVKNKIMNAQGLGLYSPVVQQVIAEVARPYIPKVVVDWTPQWFKNYVPGATAVGDRRGANFGDWVGKTINKTPKTPKTNLHDTLVAYAKDDKALTDEAREFINYNALAKLNLGDEPLYLLRYVIEGFSFAASRTDALYMTDSVVSNTSFKGVKVKEFIIKNSELRGVDFSGMGFEKEVNGWFYGKSLVANPDGVLIIRDSTIDEASLTSLREAAKAGSFKIELTNVQVIKPPVEEVATTVAGGEQLWAESSKRCAEIIIKHMRAMDFIGEELGNVKDEDLNSFLSEVMQHAFSNMPQDTLMYFPQMNIQNLYSMLADDEIINALEIVYSFDADDNVYVDEPFAVKFTEAVQKVIEDFCTKERALLIGMRDEIGPRDDIKPKEKPVAGERPDIELGK